MQNSDGAASDLYWPSVSLELCSRPRSSLPVFSRLVAKPDLVIHGTTWTPIMGQSQT